MGKATYGGLIPDSDPRYQEGYNVITPMKSKNESQMESETLQAQDSGIDPNQESFSQNDKLALQRKLMREASRKGAEKRKGLSQEELDRLASQNL